MPTIDAVASGNLTNYAVTFGGLIPQSGDTVRAGNFIVDLNASISGIRFETGPTGTGFFRIRQTEIDAAGGSLTFNNCDFVSVLSNIVCLQCSHNTGTVTIRDALITSAFNGTIAATNTGAGTLSGRTASVNTGAAQSQNGVNNSGNGIVSFTNAYGGAANFSIGLLNSGPGTANLVNSYPGTGFGCDGSRNSGAGTFNLTNAFSGLSGVSNTSQAGFSNTGAGTAFVTNAIPGDLSVVPATQNTGTGFLYVENAFGNNFGPGGTANQAFAVVGGTGTPATRTFVRKLYCGPNGAIPVSGSVLIQAATDNVFQFRTSPNGPTKTLVDSSLSNQVPAAADVRAGVVYQFGDRTGTLAVPVANQVAAGIPIDNTVGTAVITNAAIQSAVDSSVWGKVRPQNPVPGTYGAVSEWAGNVDLTPVTNSLTNISGRIPDALENGRIKAVATVSTAGLATEATQLLIKAKTDLIGTAAVSVLSPVRQDGTLNDLVVGDAYQQATGRAIQITITGVSAGLQTALATATVHLGFRAFGKSRQSPEFRRYEFAGTIVSVGASTVVRFELTTAQTKAILPGRYDYDIEFRTGGNYLTEVASVEDAPMSWLESSTTLPS